MLTTKNHKTKFRLEPTIAPSSLRQLLILYGTVVDMAKRYIAEQNLPITVDQLPVLMCIYDQGIVCQQEIADIVRRDKSSIQRSVVNLEIKGLVTVQQDRSDKRHNLLSLTDLGREVSARFA